MCTLYEWSFITILTETSLTRESKRLQDQYELKLKRGTFVLFIFILCPMAKETGGARGNSTALATETVESPLISFWWGQGIARGFTRCMIKLEI